MLDVTPPSKTVGQRTVRGMQDVGPTRTAARRLATIGLLQKAVVPSEECMTSRQRTDAIKDGL